MSTARRYIPIGRVAVRCALGTLAIYAFVVAVLLF
jgi:hypothetical protein